MKKVYTTNNNKNKNHIKHHLLFIKLKRKNFNDLY